MKLKEILNQVISEVGEGSANPYNYTRQEPKSIYSTVFNFVSDSGNKYRINISKDDDAYQAGSNEWDYDISFSVEVGSADDGQPIYSFEKEVNKGEVYRVMATVINAAKEEFKRDKKEGKIIKTIFIYPTKRSDEEGDTDYSDLRRSRVYQAYIKNHAPKGSEVYVGDNGNIEIILPDQD